MDVTHRLGLRRRAGAGAAGDHDRGRRRSSAPRRDSGLTFTDFAVRRSDIDLRTVRLVAPAVILEGRLAAVGTLDGPLHNVDLPRHGAASGRRPAAQHARRDGPPRHPLRHARRSRPTSRFEPLSFEGIRRAFPSLKAAGRAAGPLPRRGHAQPALGRRAISGASSATSTAQGIRHAAAAALGRRGPAARLHAPRPGRADRAAAPDRAGRTSCTVTGSIDTLRAPEGRPRARARPEPGARVDHRQRLRPRSACTTA